MILLRATQRLLKHRGISVVTEPPPPTAALGEWHVNAVPLPFPGRWLVLYTSTNTLLTVVAPGKGLRTTVPIFRERLPALLRRLRLPDRWVQAQADALEEICVARTNNRRVLGSMNDLAYQIRLAAEAERSFQQLDLDRLEMYLAEVPLSMLRYQHPSRVAAALARSAADG